MIYGRTPKCPKCGRELLGHSIVCGSEWLCCDCAKDPEDPLHCERGCKVEFAYPDNGREREREAARKLLAEGVAYEVESIVVGGYSSEIELKKFLGRKFNSVFFRRVQ